MKKPWQMAAAGAILGLGFTAGKANAAPVWFKFYWTSPPGSFHLVETGELPAPFPVDGVDVTVSSHEPGRTPPHTRERLIWNTRPFGGFGVGPRQRENPVPSVSADAVSHGESLFLSFDREIALLGVLSFDVEGHWTRFEGGAEGHYYEVLRPGAETAYLDPTVRSEEYELVRPEGGGDFELRRDADGRQEPGTPILAGLLDRTGQLLPSLRGQHFELRTPEREPKHARGFYWFLGGVAVDTAPIPEPSTALLTGAGLFALGFAGPPRRRGAA